MQPKEYKKKPKHKRESVNGNVHNNMSDSYLKRIKQASKGYNGSNVLENASNVDNKKLFEMFANKKSEKKACWALLCC